MFAISGDLNILWKIAAAGRSPANVCRNLHRLIHREGMTIPVKIDMVQIPVRKRRPTVKKVMVWFPVIYPSTWVSFLLREHSDLLLGGRHLNQTSLWEDLLDNFWSRYKAYDAGHPMNGAMAPPAKRTIPLYLHGDEGRGKYKLPIMVEAFQPCISFRGTAYKNSSGPLPNKFTHYPSQNIFF